MQRLRESLTLALLILLPFHAFGITVLTKIIAGPGHAPVTALALWKEALLGIILLLAMWEILTAGRVTLSLSKGDTREKTVWFDKLTMTRFLRLDPIDMLILLLIAVAITMLPVSRTSLTGQLLGIKYDFIPLIAFFILRRVSWSEGFSRLASSLLCLTASAIALYGIAALFLPMSFFTVLGYSDLHSLYVPDAALAPFQQVGGSMLRRMQSVMSGPNQLGLWMLIPWSVSLSMLLRKEEKTQAVSDKNLFLSACVLSGIAIALSFSRAAWIGAAVIAVVALWQAPGWERVRARVMFGACIVLCGMGIMGYVLFPNVLLRSASTLDHLIRPLKAVQMIIADPLGRGLGSAGPASNRISDACVFLPGGADTTWAADRPDLCVFVADKQVLPLDRICHCPVLPENWYLQIGVELGIAGMAVFVALMIAVLKALKAASCRPQAVLENATFLAMLALSIAALFLHAFEDAAVAWTVWILAAVALAHSPSHQK